MPSSKRIQRLLPIVWAPVWVPPVCTDAVAVRFVQERVGECESPVKGGPNGERLARPADSGARSAGSRQKLFS